MAITGLYQPFRPEQRNLHINIDLISKELPGKARLFGYYISPDEVYNTENNIVVTIPESSHTFVKRESAANPFRINRLIYTASNYAQLNNPLVFNFRSGYGAVEKIIWNPASYDDPMYQKTNQIKTSELKCIVDGNTDIEIDLVKNCSVQMNLGVITAGQISFMMNNMNNIVPKLENRKKIFLLLIDSK